MQDVNKFNENQKRAFIADLNEALIKLPDLRNLSYYSVGFFTAAVKDRKGKYTTRTIQGGVVFNFTTAYLGKRGDIIMVFVPKSPDTYSHVEMPFDKAKEHFGAIVDVFVSAATGKYEVPMQEINSFNKKSEKVSEKAEEERLKELMQNENWGIY